MIGISAAFQGGSIEVIACDDPAAIRVALAADAMTDHRHWFYFRLTGARDRDCRITFTNTKSSFTLPSHAGLADAWTGYQPFGSYDTETWFRVGAENVDGVFSLLHRPERDSVYYAHFPPWPLARHQKMVARALDDPEVALEVLGKTPDGWDLDLLTFGRMVPGKRVCWLIAHQHPSEPMGGWFMEGLVGRLLDPLDALARRLRSQVVFHIVPTVNPDGIARGHSRTNALGADLNRAWAADPGNAPEVMLIRRRMKETGVDFFLDVHGDEMLPYNFLGGPLEIPSKSARLADLFRRFARAWGRANPDYRLGPPYPGGPPEKADLRMAWNSVAEEYGCLAVLLEQPFKDNAESGIPGVGWTAERSVMMGRSSLDALAAVLKGLR